MKNSFRCGSDSDDALAATQTRLWRAGYLQTTFSGRGVDHWRSHKPGLQGDLRKSAKPPSSHPQESPGPFTYQPENNAIDLKLHNVLTGVWKTLKLPTPSSRVRPFVNHGRLGFVNRFNKIISHATTGIPETQTLRRSRYLRVRSSPVLPRV